jgi:hypothetical protein
MVSLSHETEVKEKIRIFLRKAIDNINDLSAEELVNDAAINPFLVKALEIRDIDSFAKFYVYQRVGRSVVTSFGTTMEHMIRALSGGEKQKWWDIKANIQGKTYYMSVKSGPNDMNKDQVELFAQRAREILEREPDAIPIIAMCYGREPMGPIATTLRNEGLDPSQNTLTGKKLYETITGQPDYYERLLELVGEATSDILRESETIKMIDEKVKEIADWFKGKYGTLDNLLLDTF